MPAISRSSNDMKRVSKNEKEFYIFRFKDVNSNDFGKVHNDKLKIVIFAIWQGFIYIFRFVTVNVHIAIFFLLFRASRKENT